MKTRFAVVATVFVVAACCGWVAATPNRLRVVSQVHAHPDVFVNGEEKRAKRHGHCVDSGAVNEDPVCASNGRQYLNEEVFEFHQCLIKAEYGEIWRGRIDYVLLKGAWYGRLKSRSRVAQPESAPL
jgi:hypothetical protein